MCSCLNQKRSPDRLSDQGSNSMVCDAASAPRRLHSGWTWWPRMGAHGSIRNSLPSVWTTSIVFATEVLRYSCMSFRFYVSSRLCYLFAVIAHPSEPQSCGRAMAAQRRQRESNRRRGVSNYCLPRFVLTRPQSLRLFRLEPSIRATQARSSAMTLPAQVQTFIARACN